MSSKNEVNYSVQELLGVGFTLIVLGIGIAYGLDASRDIRDDFVTNTQSAGGPGCNATATDACNFQWNASNDAMTGVSKLTEKLPTIATVVVASVVIGILVTYLWARFARK